MSDPYAANDAQWTKPFQVVPDDEPRQLREIVRYAILAPNAHNTQGWQFQPGDREVRVFPDFSRRMPHSDPGDRELFISLGCAVENLTLAARHVGWEPTVEYFPDDVDERCVRVRFGDGQPEVGNPRFEAIPRRQSNRRKYDEKAIPTDDLAAIEAAGKADGIEGLVVTDRADRAAIVDVVKGGFDYQASSRPFREELASWIRFSKAANAEHRDGISARATGRPHFPDWIGRQMVHLLSKVKLDQAEIVAKMASSPALLALVTTDNDEETWVRAGRSLIRMKLEAVARGVVNAHLNNNWQWEATFQPARDALGLGERYPQVVIRLGYAPRLPYSTRRPVEDVLLPPPAE